MVSGLGLAARNGMPSPKPGRNYKKHLEVNGSEDLAIIGCLDGMLMTHDRACSSLGPVPSPANLTSTYTSPFTACFELEEHEGSDLAGWLNRHSLAHRDAPSFPGAFTAGPTVSRSLRIRIDR